MHRLMLLALALILMHATPAADIAVAPKGEFATIDTRLANETIKTLLSGSKSDRAKAIESVRTAPQKYAPPVFYAMSSALFAVDKDDAAFWFYAGQLRARYDANRCADSSARQAVGVLNQQFGTPINQYTFKDLGKLKVLVERVVEWDRNTPHDYDHRWINLHGMSAMMAGLSGKSANHSMSAPDNEWEAIAERTRTDYLRSFNEMLESMSMGDDRYLVTKDSVTYVSLRGERTLVPTDPATFEKLPHGYGRDRSKVFRGGNVIEGAERDSFSPIDESLSRDKARVYIGTFVCDECDSKSFRKIGEKAYADDRAVYTHTIGFNRIEGADAASFVVLNNWFAKDKNRVYVSGESISGADAASFKTGTRGECVVCAEDVNRCYSYEKAVPCEGKGRQSAPEGEIKLPAGGALLLTSSGVNFNLSDLPGRLSRGYVVTEPGRKTLKFECWNGMPRQKVVSMKDIEILAGRYYRFRPASSVDCSVELEQNALILGQVDGPEVSLARDRGQGPTLFLEVPGGQRTLDVTCVKVTRKAVIEVPVRLSVELIAGGIYRLSGTLDTSGKHCDVTVVPQFAGAATP